MVVNVRTIKRKTRPVGTIAAGLFLCLTCSLSAKQVGKFSYKGTPEDYTTSKFNGTVIVSDTMVAMAEKIHVVSQFLTDSIMDTPSIFFIIDNSGSMSTVSSPTDRPGNRFKVTSAFIDTIYKKFPTADIGIATFKSQLYFRSKDSPLFAALPTQYDAGGAYLPLYTLNGMYGGQTGISILQRFLETKTYTGSNGTYTDLTYVPSEEVKDATNINVGFEAAKKGLEASPRPKERRYVVFLSDGDVHDLIKDPGYDENAFEKGIGVPTTFTVFFTKKVGAAVPGSIQRMTGNIRLNGYSQSNPRSNYWPFYNTDFNTLMNFLLANVYSAIVTSKPAHPISIAVNGQIVSPWNQSDSSFLFNGLFPLTGLVTPFSYQIKYPTKTGGDTTNLINFNVKTEAGFVMPSADFEIKLWDRDITFSHNNVPITVATEAMAQLGLSFPWNGGTAGYRYTNVTIDLYTSTPPIDHETVTLTAGTNVFTGTFKRATAAVKTPMNGVLENNAAGDDNIIAVFRNGETPKLPLDTLRVALPLKITLLAVLQSAVTQDLDGNGYLDHIVISFDKAISVANNAGPAFTIQCNTTTFPVESITKLTDSTYSLALKEQQQNPVPQTSWKPGVGIHDLNGVADVAGFIAADGAPPVVWTVIKQVVSEENHATDTVTVTLSEKISGTGGTPFGVANQPYQTFFVWSKNGAAFTKIDAMLAGITVFTKVVDDSILVFAMTNNLDLNESHWVNIQDIPKPLCDKAGNFPTDVNQKVQVKVIYKIPAAALDSAFTRDRDGDGYLDHIDLFFDRTAEITNADIPSFSVRLGGLVFPIDSVIKLTNRSYSLRLLQHAEPSPLETSLRPGIGISQVKKVADVANYPPIDGAPPVIFTAVKQIVNPDDWRADTVTVTLSEKIFDKNGAAFSFVNQPDETFCAWVVENGFFVRVDSVLAGIDNFAKAVAADSILVFTMSNNRELTSDNWLNIRTPSMLRDGRGNFPLERNRKVRVRVLNPAVTITSVPNPSTPTVKHNPDGTLNFHHEPNALQWVINENAGVAIILKNADLPPKGSSWTLGGYIKIYDAIGNLVNQGESPDILNGLGGSLAAISIYWNELNSSGMPVAPGVYRVVVQLKFPPVSQLRDKTLFTRIGIRR